ncbi:hypothetical protein Ancab_012168 [Ancistrocladus abbreviatus]
MNRGQGQADAAAYDSESCPSKLTNLSGDDDAEDMGKASTGIGEVEVCTKYGVDHPIFVDALPPSTSEAVPQNEEGLTQEANVPQSEVGSGDEDWSTDNVSEEELGSDFDELFELRRQNFIRKQDKKGDIPRMMRPATTDAPQPKKSKGRPRKSSNNPSSANPPPSMEQPPSSTQEHPSRA